MNKRIAALTFVAVSWSGLHAQTATDLNEGLTISHDPVTYPTLPFELVWWTRPAFYYFVLQTSDLREEWSYHDYAVKGTPGAGGLGDDEGFRFDSSASKLFFRIEFTDDPNANVLLADFDRDFISNKAELDQGTDPFSRISLDGDTIPDDWELFYNLDTTAGVDSSLNHSDSDSLTDYQEFHAGTDPNLANTVSTDTTGAAALVVWRHFR